MKKLNNNTARERMTIEVPIFKTDDKTGDIISTIHTKTQEYKTIDYVYLVGKGKTLEGIISFRDLLKKDPSLKVSKIMNKKIISVYPGDDQQKAVAKAINNSLKAIPVIDKNKKLLGVIQTHTLLDILHEEHTEDLFKLAGIEKDKTAVSSFSERVKSRTPWIIFGLIWGIFAASIIGIFGGILESFIILAMYIPIMMNVSDSVGNQASIIYIRNESLNRIKDRFIYIVKELEVGLTIAFICAILLAGVTFFIHQDIHMSFIISLSLFFAAFFGMLVGVCSPIILEKLGKDPANGSGPLVTAFLDIISLSVYLITASIFLSIL